MNSAADGSSPSEHLGRAHDEQRHRPHRAERNARASDPAARHRKARGDRGNRQAGALATREALVARPRTVPLCRQ